MAGNRAVTSSLFYREESLEAIVLSRSKTSQAFLLWCEDQGALAILPLSLCTREMPEVGDLLKVDLIEDGLSRICSGFSIITVGALPGVGQMLRHMAGPPEPPEPENRVFLSLVSPV